jgi:hypothetical protein
LSPRGLWADIFFFEKQNGDHSVHLKETIQEKYDANNVKEKKIYKVKDKVSEMPPIPISASYRHHVR